MKLKNIFLSALCLIFVSACGGDESVSSTSISSPMPPSAPLPQSPPVTENVDNVIEAEILPLQSNFIIVNDPQASAGSYVAGITQAGGSVFVVDAQAAEKLRVAYKSSSDTTLKIMVDGKEAGEFFLTNTVDKDFSSYYGLAEIRLATQASSSLELLAEEDGITLGIDTFEFISSPFQIVETIAKVPPGSDGVSLAKNGDIYISGGFEGTLTRVSSEGEVSQIDSGYGSVNGSDFDSQGNFYFAAYLNNAVYKRTPGGNTTVFAEGLDGPAGLYIDEKDDIYVSLYGADFSGTGAAVIKISAASGAVTTYASGGGLADVIGITGDEHGNIYAGNWSDHKLVKIVNGQVMPFVDDVGVPVNMIDYSDGYIYIPNNSIVARVNLQGEVSTFAGSASRKNVDGDILSAEFVQPNSVAASEDGGVLIVVDTETGDVRRITSR